MAGSVAVLLDATLVRMVATPAVLQLMGRANWWFPPVLERAVPNFLAEIQSGQINANQPSHLTTKDIRCAHHYAPRNHSALGHDSGPCFTARSCIAVRTDHCGRRPPAR